MHRLTRRSWFSTLATLAVASASRPSAAGKLNVVTTFTILGDMVRNVGREHVALTTLVGPDADAHVYEPTPADARTLARADLVVVNGLLDVANIAGALAAADPGHALCFRCY